MTIASWEISDVMFLNIWCWDLERHACYHGNKKKNINNEIKTFPRNNDKCVVYVNTENKKFKEHIP